MISKLVFEPVSRTSSSDRVEGYEMKRFALLLFLVIGLGIAHGRRLLLGRRISSLRSTAVEISLREASSSLSSLQVVAASGEQSVTSSQDALQ